MEFGATSNAITCVCVCVNTQISVWCKLNFVFPLGLRKHLLEILYEKIPIRWGEGGFLKPSRVLRKIFSIISEKPFETPLSASAALNVSEYDVNVTEFIRNKI